MPSAFEIALTKAKVEFLNRKDAIFMSTVCFHLQIKESTDVETLGTDGVNLVINPDFFMAMTKGQQVTALAHETWHVLAEHGQRIGTRNRDKYNRAGDYMINLELTDAGYEPIGPIPSVGFTGWLWDDQYRGMSTEQIYDKLPDDPESPNPMDGDIMPGPSGMSPEEVQEHVKGIIMQAATVARMSGQPGSIPGQVQVYLDGLLKPKLPLNVLLRRFFTDLGKNDYTWSRPNRRYAPEHYLPSMKGGQLMHLAFAFDMSCSVTDDDIKRYVTELMQVLRMMKPDVLTLIQFDTQIISVDQIRSVGDMMKVKLVGRGGTSIHPLMDWAVKNKPNALIVFSDGEYQHPVTKPKCPVLWMIHGRNRNRFHCDFGKTITFDVGDDDQ